VDARVSWDVVGTKERVPVLTRHLRVTLQAIYHIGFLREVVPIDACMLKIKTQLQK
jgi:hypothetical protein